MNTILLLGLILGAPPAAGGEPLVLENDLVRWTIGPDGVTRGLVEKKTGRQWARPAPLAMVKKAGKWQPATAAARQAGLWQIRFGDSGIAIDSRVTVRPRYFVFELAAVHGEGIEELCLARIDANISENYGGGLNVAWNDRFAVAVLGLSDRVNTAGPPGWASVSPEFGMAGEKAAVLAVPKPQLLAVIQEVEQDCGLPSPRLGGQWAKTSADVRRGYLFINLTEANADEVIAYARLGEFGYVMIYDSTWSASLGSYPINTANYPRGEASLRATVAKLHAAGLKAGMHMLTSFVGKNDPLVQPKPDPRLLRDAAAVLAAEVDAKAAELRSTLPLDGFPGVPAFYGDNKQGMDLVLDDEIVHYARCDAAARTFRQCVRGYAGTRPAPTRPARKSPTSRSATAATWSICGPRCGTSWPSGWRASSTAAAST